MEGINATLILYFYNFFQILLLLQNNSLEMHKITGVGSNTLDVSSITTIKTPGHRTDARYSVLFEKFKCFLCTSI